MTRIVCCVAWVTLFGLGAAAAESADNLAGDPAEVICTVNDRPIYRGEFNLLLAEQLAGKSIDTASATLKQAIALTLVRRHLAMQTLSEMGGDALQERLKAETQQAARQAEQSGDSLSQIATRAGSDMRSLGRDLVWKIAWAQYLRSRLTEQNLERFFAANRSKYDGTQVHVSHLFVPQQDDDQESKRQSWANLQALSEQIAAAEDVAAAFAAAAREHSQSTSANRDGDLGWVGAHGDLPAPVSDALLAAPVGQVVGPIESALGWHLLFIHQRKAGEGTIEQMSDQAILRRDAVAAMFTALVRRQGDAKVEWMVDELKPPVDASVIP